MSAFASGSLRAAALGASIALAVPGSALASVPDTFGIGGRWQGAGGGGVAVVDDGTAALLNPAGLSRVRRPTAAVGLTVADPRFLPIPDLWWDVNRDGVVDELDPPLPYDADVNTSVGVSLFTSRHIGGKFGLGFAAYVPSRNLIRFNTFDPELPNYVMWDNRLERFVAAFGVGGEVLPGLSVGASVDALASARLELSMTADAKVVGPDDDSSEIGDLVSEVVIDVHAIEVAVVPALAPVFGVQFDVGRALPTLDGLVLGASYHGEVGLGIDVDLDIQANADISGIGDLEPFLTAILVDAELALFDHYVPQRVNLGLAYRRANTLTLYLDGRWSDWRRLRLNVAQLTDATVTSPLIDIDDLVIDGNAHRFIMRSVWGMRMGGDIALPEWTVGSDLRYVRLAFRGGFGIEPSPLVDQAENSNLLDAGRTMFTLGAGVEVWDPFELTDGAVRLDLFGQYHLLAAAGLPRSTDHPRAGYPRTAPSIPVGGNVVAFGAQWSFEY